MRNKFDCNICELLNICGNAIDCSDPGDVPKYIRGRGNCPKEYELMDKLSSCNLTTCRHNKDGKCISVENRVVCVDVSKKVLCMGDNKDENN